MRGNKNKNNYTKVNRPNTSQFTVQEPMELLAFLFFFFRPVLHPGLRI